MIHQLNAFNCITHIESLNPAIPHHIRTHTRHSLNNDMIFDRDTARPEPTTRLRIRVRRMVLQNNPCRPGQRALRRVGGSSIMALPVWRHDARDRAGFRGHSRTLLLALLLRGQQDRAIRFVCRMVGLRGVHGRAGQYIRQDGGLRLRPRCRFGLLSRWLHPLAVGASSRRISGGKLHRVLSAMSQAFSAAVRARVCC